MIRYLGILERDPGSLWGIWFPDLPGCATAGETADIALDRAPDVLRLWIEDAQTENEALPRARSIEDLKQDAEVREALSAGHAVIVVQIPEFEAMAG
ncbi:type II toxin-antitoxin system HicB family antitoxin [Methylobacterium trifolii]|uniref:HicB-like antitoxin of toxin-antitoxin system domain-containing protein n=1 Tax=Methylobacterium trifolii TaxID=1003092 RepID=A0ABQ4U666_9HYPH|nr:type II toxin-antitoxin system HicB family antitoxin [Methylobacterium trifolii]GJE61868.1 hypothetical protein MPOCJGCO_3994 [Methylobacterium trifolii]